VIMKTSLLTILLAVCPALFAQGVQQMLLTAAPSGGTNPPIAVDTWATIGYTASGTNTTSYTASGTNLVAVVEFWSDGTVSPAPTCNGSTATLATSHANTYQFAGTKYIYLCVGVPAGTWNVVVVSTGQVYGAITTIKNAKQSGQPDAVAAYVSGTLGGSAGAATANLAITTVADKCLVVGVYGANQNLSLTPSANGGEQGQWAFGAQDTSWISTASVTPAGSFTLQAQGSSNGLPYDAIGVSIAPL
jgi:hypothetical protein